MRKKRSIWIINHYSDGPWGPATRHFDLTKSLVNDFETTIIASSFNHCTLKDTLILRNEWWKSDKIEGVNFVWIKTPPYSKNDARRYFNIVIFFIRTFLYSIRKERPDIIIGSSPHLLNPLVAYLIASLKKTSFIFEIRDLWPDGLVDLKGLSKKSFIYKILKKIELFLYRKARIIISVLPHIDEYLEENKIDVEKFRYLPNGITVQSGTSSFLQNLQHKDKQRPFTLLYVGGIQNYNGLDSLLRAAKILQEKMVSNVIIRIVGSGSDKKRLINYVVEHNLINVHFENFIPKTEVPRVLQTADVLVHSFRPLHVFKRYGVSPIKIADYFLAEKPILYIADTRNNPVEEAFAGLTASPENPDEIVEKILTLKAMGPEARMNFGKNGKKYATEKLNNTLIALQLKSIIAYES